MLSFIRFLRGYVRIKVSGYAPERFLNLCSNHNILLWNIENHCDYYMMCVSVKGFFQLKSLCQKTKTRVALMERYGLPFFIPKMRKRKVFFIGLFFCIFGMIFLSNFIWSIEIEGNTSITDDVFVDYLETQHIFYGMRKKNIDIEALEKGIRKDYNQITWTSAKLKGTRLEVAVKENEFPNVDEVVLEGNSNLIASKDGIIVGMVTRRGVPLKAKGMEVKAGEVLIAGEIPILGEDQLPKTYRYCEADGDVLLQCKYQYMDEIAIEYQQNCFSGREKKIPFFEVGGNQYAFYVPKTNYLMYDTVTDKKQVKLFQDFYLPIYYGKIVKREYYVEDKKYSMEEAETLLEERFLKFIVGLEEKGVQIIEKNVRIERIGNKIRKSGEVTVVERTGESEIIERK